MSLNKVMLIGNVGQDPEVRYLDNSNAKVASFRLATTERYRDRNGELRENTEWHSIVAWRNSADLTEKWIRKGTSIFVEGRLRTRSWDDQQGQRHSVTEVVADNIQLLGKKSDNPANGTGSNAPAGFQPRQPQSQPQPHTQAHTQTQPYPSAAQPVTAPVQPIVTEEDGSDDLPF